MCNSRKTHSKEEENLKSLALSSLRKDPITNQDKQIMRLNKYQFLIPNVLTFLPGYKRLLNEENDDNPENTDTSQYEKGYMSHTR